MRRTTLLEHTSLLFSADAAVDLHCGLLLPPFVRTFFSPGAKLLIPHSKYFCSVFNSHQFTLLVLKFIQLYTSFFPDFGVVAQIFQNWEYTEDSFMRMAQHTMHTYRNPGTCFIFSGPRFITVTYLSRTHIWHSQHRRDSHTQHSETELYMSEWDNLITPDIVSGGVW